MSLRKNLFVALIAVGAVSILAENSHAFFGLFGGSHGSCGSWGGSWGSRGSWGSCGSHGGYYGGRWGSHGSWGGSWGGSHGSWGGSHGGHAYYEAGPHGAYARRGNVDYGRIVATQSPSSATVAESNTKTRLTLHVPAEATVTLAGVVTKQTGEVRQFTTTKLAAGQVWDDYEIVVTMERNGHTLREERTITLTGGQPQELSINFDSQQLAQR
jgi:uncharacterized protein (TIGR03000 family)